MNQSESIRLLDVWRASVGPMLATTLRPDTTLTMAPDGDDRGDGLDALLEERSLEMQGILGEGGMGVIREARQSCLGRQVAVKMLQEGVDSSAAIRALIREAQVTGLLDHPNIVPIHYLTTENDRPAIVLKKIEGHNWSHLIDRADLVQAMFAADDALEWNIKVLLKVIDAVRFAHSRGILHRDLKPSNVMIGDFGETYVMDWGIAVSLIPSQRVHLPLAQDVQEIAGTPAYMAPEMLTPQSVSLSERTDVYLLGAILYQILMGKAPHVAETATGIFEKISKSQPSFDEGLPVELVSLCLRAMRQDPAQRFQSVEEFRLALLDYLDHRGGRVLVTRARSLLASLEAQIAKPSNETGGQAHRNAVFSIFGPCRFAFQEALRAWQGNDEAKAGLYRCTELVVDYELAQGEPASASALLAELGVADGGLFDRVQLALQERGHQKAEAARLRQRADRSIDLGSRRTAIACLGMIWTVVPIALELLLEDTSYSSQTAAHLGFFLLTLLAGHMGKEWLHSTSLNHHLYRIVVTSILLVMIINLGSWLLGESPERAQVYHLFIFFAAGSICVMLVEWHAWPTALAYLVAFLLSANRPDLGLWTMSASNAVLVVNVLVIWGAAPGSRFRAAEL